jgi:hypothetical protein
MQEDVTRGSAAAATSPLKSLRAGLSCGVMTGHSGAGSADLVINVKSPSGMEVLLEERPRPGRTRPLLSGRVADEASPPRATCQ